MSTNSSVPQADRNWLRVLGTLNEAQARLFVAEKAVRLGYGGVSKLCKLTGMSRPTIMKGAAELSLKKPLSQEAGRIRRSGGGRQKVEASDPAVVRTLTRIVEETTAGDPMSMLKWTSKSTRIIAEEMTKAGHPMTGVTVARCLHDMGYSLQANAKSIEGRQHSDRNAQFNHINAQVKSYLRTGNPVISVDTKKKELVGHFQNRGQSWRLSGKPHNVFVHDFPHMGEGKAIPYGTYDVAEDKALVNVGMTHDTAEFAVESIRRWWRMLGKKTYQSATRLLICADAGGSNGNRLRAWRMHLQQLSNQIGIPISVCHYPPGTSKWNRIEHRLFSFISIHWKGQPLVSYETIVNLIGSTKTKSGLKVKAVLDSKEYRTGEKFTRQQIESLSMKGHTFHPDWNYTISPQVKNVEM